jgi:hypothetical protein
VLQVQDLKVLFQLAHV